MGVANPRVGPLNIVEEAGEGGRNWRWRPMALVKQSDLNFIVRCGGAGHSIRGACGNVLGDWRNRIRRATSSFDIVLTSRWVGSFVITNLPEEREDWQSQRGLTLELDEVFRVLTYAE